MKIDQGIPYHLINVKISNVTYVFISRIKAIAAALINSVSITSEITNVRSVPLCAFILEAQ